MASPTKRASRATFKPPAWLLQDYIPLGALTVLDGDKGVFKSTLMVDLAARISTGRALPLHPAKHAVLPGPAHVLIYQYEDPESHFTGMLERAGADMDRVRVAYSNDKGPPLTLPKDMRRLARLAFKAKAKLIVIDPMTGELIQGGMNNATAVYQATAAQ